MSAIVNISTTSPAGPSSEFQQEMQAARKTAMDAAAKSLNLSTSALQQQLQSGKSLQDVAVAQGVDYSKVQNAITTAVKPQLDQAVQSGSMTSQQETSALGNLTSLKAHKGHHHHGGGTPPAAASAASTSSSSSAAEEVALLTTPSYSATGTPAPQSTTPGTVLNQAA